MSDVITSNIKGYNAIQTGKVHRFCDLVNLVAMRLLSAALTSSNACRTSSGWRLESGSILAALRDRLNGDFAAQRDSLIPHQQYCFSFQRSSDDGPMRNPTLIIKDQNH